MESIPTVGLRPGEAQRILAGHPWIFEGAIHGGPESAEDGDLVEVVDHRGRSLGVGFYNGRSRIRVRMLAPERLRVDERFFEERVRAALAVRRRHMPQATSFRVVNSESDFLSGLIVDKYEHVAVVQISSLGMDRRKPMILAALREVLEPRVVVERGDIASRRLEGLPEATEVVSGTLEGPVTARINGLAFDVDVLSGQKTGMYLDQQVNYERVAELAAKCAGARVLDCFAFLGGFALHCARAGAAHVHLLDQSDKALAAARRAAAANGFADRCTYEAANVFDWLKQQSAARAEARRFDVIVLDPPPFARGRATVPDALRGYKEIHLRALKLLEPGGILATFCCSHHVGRELFEEVIVAAAEDVRRVLRRVAVYQQSPDHPVIPTIPETEYLKGYAFEVVR